MTRMDKWLDGISENIKKKDKEIEQLKKEKEWLINKLIRLDYPRTIPEIHKYSPVSEGHWRFIINEMQQALKEG